MQSADADNAAPSQCSMYLHSTLADRHAATYRARTVGWTEAASGCMAGRSLWFLGSACERAMIHSISQGEPERGRCWAEGEQQEQEQEQEQKDASLRLEAPKATRQIYLLD